MTELAFTGLEDTGPSIARAQRDTADWTVLHSSKCKRLTPDMKDHRHMTLGDLPRRSATLWGEHEALCFEGQRWNYAQFSLEVDRYAKALIGAQVSPKDRIAVWMTNRPELLFLLYAIARVGAVSVPLNTRYKSEDAAYAISQSRSNLLIAMNQSGPINYEQMIAEIFAPLNKSQNQELNLKSYPELRQLIMFEQSTLNGVTDWEQFLSLGGNIADSVLEERAESVKVSDHMAILYTSGTTGNPKGAIHSHTAIQNTMERTQILKFTENDSHMSYLPLFHLYGFSEVAIAAMFCGSKQILMDTFDAGAVLDLAEQEQATIFHGFDVHWIDLLRQQRKSSRSLNFRLGTYPAGTESSAVLAKQVQEVFGPTVSGWGMTESWAFVACNRPDDSEEQRTMASGSVMPGYEIRVVNPETHRDVPYGEQGVLFVRGYAQMKGYFDKPEETAQTIDAEGWLNTGDYARLRDDGHIVFLGRYKDILKVGGENISPTEIESRLLMIDGVDDVAVVGIADSRLGEIPVAFVISTSPALTADDVVAQIRGQIASFKVPRHVFFMNNFPVTASGKVRKVELRAIAENKLITIGSISYQKA
ncbi:MAG: fatty-acyl-CoA synthase [Parasphingorhabdus sp.]|jgi:fatty-acyl-CoA synthase